MADPVRVLHVDDDPEFAGIVSTVLERDEGQFRVETEASAADGLARLRDGAFDAVVSDYEMTDRDGLEFLEAVREAHPNLPFILYTGRGSEELASEAISAGVTDYLQKGTGTGQFDVLANRVRNAVERYRSRAAGRVGGLQPRATAREPRLAHPRRGGGRARPGGGPGVARR